MPVVPGTAPMFMEPRGGLDRPTRTPQSGNQHIATALVSHQIFSIKFTSAESLRIDATDRWKTP